MNPLVLCALLAATPAPTPERALSFSDAGWQTTGSAAVETFEGRETLRVESGAAYRRDVSLQDGTLDFDVQLTRRRSFAYVMVRMADEREFEEFYLRPHKSGLPDALQYAPVWQGQSAWQLHHGPGGTAAAEFEPGAWTHVRVVLQGRQAALFVGDMQKPALLVPHVAREPRAGFIALRGFLPAGVPGNGPIARFANVTVRPGFVPFDFPAAAAAPQQPGAVREWSVSQALPATKADGVPHLPAADALGTFQRVAAEPSGLVELHRHVKLPAGTREGTALARVRIRATEAGVRRLDLGFSDRATVFLNGRALYTGDASYSYDAPRQEGLIGYGQTAVFLPLEKGDNELAVLVGDSFGGWGLMARFPDAAGLALDAP
jgi:hypothetical protein